MAIRREDLVVERSAVVYRFPPVQARRRRRAEIRRRRLALASVGLVVAAAGLFATGPSGSVSAAQRATPRAVTVQAGDTLWGLAERHAPVDMDTRAYLDSIMEQNGIGAVVEPGTRIRLP